MSTIVFVYEAAREVPRVDAEHDTAVAGTDQQRPEAAAAALRHKRAESGPWQQAGRPERARWIQPCRMHQDDAGTRSCRRGWVERSPCRRMGNGGPRSHVGLCQRLDPICAFNLVGFLRLSPWVIKHHIL